jgi:hypothetical protein
MLIKKLVRMSLKEDSLKGELLKIYNKIISHLRYLLDPVFIRNKIVFNLIIQYLLIRSSNHKNRA